MGDLRVIAGSARGQRLNSVPGNTTRPITNRTKESLFNIIGADIQDTNFLDLFAGTGSVGIEALSRGARYARFIDNHRTAIKTIHQNLKITHLEIFSDVVNMDAHNYLAGTADKVFEYVYIAPPQYKLIWKRAVIKIDSEPGWLAPDAWVIVQIHPVEYEQLNTKNLFEFDRRKYGSTLLVFFDRGVLNSDIT